jgi:nitrogen-specific signal transduction histidine kinase
MPHIKRRYPVHKHPEDVAMSETKENILRENQLTALGNLLAGYTHELKNHLGIINESSGLMGDILEMSEGVDDQISERFKKIITTIGQRIAQANTMAKFLNNLAHRMDEPDSTFHVNDILLENIAFLVRFARLKSISFKQNMQEDLPSINNNPGLLHFVIFRLMQKIIEQIESNTEILLSSATQDHNVMVTLEFPNVPDLSITGEDPAQTDEALHLAMTKMNLTLSEECSGQDRRRISMVIPSR